MVDATDLNVFSFASSFLLLSEAKEEKKIEHFFSYKEIDNFQTQGKFYEKYHKKNPEPSIYFIFKYKGAETQ